MLQQFLAKTNSTLEEKIAFRFEVILYDKSQWAVKYKSDQSYEGETFILDKNGKFHDWGRPGFKIGLYPSENDAINAMNEFIIRKSVECYEWELRSKYNV